MILFRLIIILILLISIFVFCNNKETFQSKSDNLIFKEIITDYLSYIKKYIGLMRQIYTVYIVIINFLTINTTIDKINGNVETLSNNLLKIYNLHEKIYNLTYTQNWKDTKYKEFQIKLNENHNEIKRKKKSIYDYYDGNGVYKCDELNINNTKINNLFSNIPDVVDSSSNYSKIDFDYLNIKLASYNKKKIIEFFNNSDVITNTLDNDIEFFNFLKDNLIDIQCVKLLTTQSQLQSQVSSTKQLKIFQNLTSEFILYESELDNILINLNKPGMVIDEDANKNFFDTTNKNQMIENKFCEKLKKLDKPKKKNLIFKRFSQDIIEKKKKYITKMYAKIQKLLDKQSNSEIYNTNIDRLYSHNISKKKYDAIVKGIDNIKNRNKIKINLI